MPALRSNGLDYTAMAALTDQAAIEGCIASGLIVIVEICSTDLYSIAGIVSAHTNVDEAFAAYSPHGMDDDYAIVIPQEAGPLILYSWTTHDELLDHTSK